MRPRTKLRRHKFERLKPDGKDWNDDLKAARTSHRPEAARRPRKTLLQPLNLIPPPPLLTPDLSFRVDWRVRWPRGHRGAQPLPADAGVVG